MGNKLYFAPLPPRAIGDDRLTMLHLKVLACVALHDRMAGAIKRGQGCWAGPTAIASKCGANVTNVSTAVSDLERWGYIERKDNPPTGAGACFMCSTQTPTRHW